ncbi:E3 ubiquitin-protein ligase MIB2-like [Pomacea canaliculata]|uniref:E3 ubiquitin-protein ligase MIB2-like n=1 Tax=Pomacea canaliculata TaxID=400727 RepID=UPI000D72FDBE|nr:E3 ubiquitin-protein ligase MIB2-like [Pomacea canaliculata]
MVDKGTTVEDHFDREATGLQYGTLRELQETGHLLFNFANDCEKNETVEFSSDEEREETEEQERKLKVDVGDNVAIKVGESRLEELQKTHGGCTQQMKKAIGSTGCVVTKTKKGSIFVEFKSLGQFSFSPEALVKVSPVKQGETVRIRPDEDQVKTLNRRVGWKDEMTLTLGKVGRVAKVDSDGDLLVVFGRLAFLYSPACCLPAPNAQTDNLDKTEKTITNKVTARTSDIEDDAKEKNKAMFLKMRQEVLGRSLMSFTGQSDQEHRLFNAIYKGDCETVARLCRGNKFLLASRHQQTSPLILASTRHSLEVVELLLDLGADINAVVPPNMTALRAAIDAKRENICSLLIDRGADLTYTDPRGMSYLHCAAYQDLPKVINILTAYGVDINAKDRYLNTPLLLALNRGAHRAVDALLSVPGININTRCNTGINALQVASHAGYARALEKMLAIDKSGVNDFYRGHFTSLHLASNRNHADCVRLLVINGGADINLKNVEDSCKPRYIPPATGRTTVWWRLYLNSGLKSIYWIKTAIHLYTWLLVSD